MADDPIDPLDIGSIPGTDEPCGCDCDGARDGPTTPSIFADDRGQMERRDYAKVLATLAGLGAVGSLSAPLVGLTQVFEREYTGPIYSEGIYLVDSEGERVQEGRLAPGDLLTVFPEPRQGIEKAPTLLVRFEDGDYGGETNPEFVVSGYAAYSKVCTHAGCMVSEREGEQLICPCHQGKFDPLSGAAVTGGPPPRALPQLPLALSDDGALIATGDFQGPIGPGGE